jgi:hypothetical protein
VIAEAADNPIEPAGGGVGLLVFLTNSALLGLLAFNSLFLKH